MTQTIDSNTKALRRFVGQDRKLSKYLHNTDSEENAKSILKNGFQFISHLDYSADNVSGDDPVELNYFNLMRRRYGDFTVLIQISRNIVEKYSKKLHCSKHHFSEVIVLGEPLLSEDDEPIYTLPNFFIKGYFNNITKEMNYNPDFNPHEELPIFDKNVKKILLKE